MSNKDPDSWMWERAQHMIEQADRMQRQFFHPGRTGARRPSWEPPIDIYETTTELWVQVALPGVEPDRVQVEIEDSTLRVYGHRPMPNAFRSAVVHRIEIPHGRFEREIELPAGSYELHRRELVNGCLFLNFRKLD